MKRIVFVIITFVFSGIALGQQKKTYDKIIHEVIDSLQTNISLDSIQGELPEVLHDSTTIQIPELVLDSTDFFSRNKWFVGVGAGASYYIGDHNRQAKIIDMMNSAYNIYVGRWITKVLSLRLGFTGFQAKTLRRTWGTPVVSTDRVGLTGGIMSTDSPYGTGKEYKLKTGEYGELQRFKYMNLHFDLMFNITSLLYTEEEYNKHRLDISPYLGIGYAVVIESKMNRSWSANFGLYTSCKITKDLSAVLDLHAGTVEDSFDGVPGARKGEAIMSGTVGLNYRF